MITAATPNQERSTIEPILYVAFELSNRTWKLGFTIGLGQKPREQNIAARDLERLDQVIEAAKKRFGLPPSARVVSCFEAGRDGFWLHRHLESRGIENLVVDPSSLEVKRRPRKAKTDRLDVGKLLKGLIRYYMGESKVWSVVHVPSAEDEDARHLHRELEQLKRERTRLTNRVKGLLATQGVCLRGRGQRHVEATEWRRWDGTPLLPGLRNRLARELDRLRFVNRQIQQVEQERSEQLMTSPRRAAHQARALIALRGIGVNTAWVYAQEFFGWRAFGNGKEVGALAGLTPTPSQSGDRARELGMSKSGNRCVRAIAIESAWSWLRYQPDSALSQWYQERFGAGGGRMRRIGIVALARKLLIALWRYLETGEIPAGAVLKLERAAG
jgi:transposase